MNNSLYFDSMMKVIEKGIEILSTINQYPPHQALRLFNSWQDYSKTVVKYIAEINNVQIYLNYLDFIIKLAPYAPYEQLTQSISWLMDLTKDISNSGRW